MDRPLDSVLKETLSNDPAIQEKLELRDKLHAKLKPFCRDGKLLDFRGHFKQGEAWYTDRWTSAESRLERVLLETILFSLGDLEQVQRLLEAVESGEELEEPLVLGRGMPGRECGYCSQRISLGFNGKGLVWVGKPCPHADGLVTEWELNVPSGKLLVANDLRRWFPLDGGDLDLNAMVGRHLTTLAYAEVGLAHGFVGNTCPDVFRDDADLGDRFVIGSFSSLESKLSPVPPYEDENEQEPENPWGEPVASICTDLWWYSLADYDEFVRRWEYLTPDESLVAYLKDHRLDIVDVRPGVYRFRQPQDVDPDALTVEFATFEWVREPDPVRDYIREDQEKSLTATECLIQECLTWPTLYMGVNSIDGDDSFETAVELWQAWSPQQKAQGLARAADRFMCALGGGVEWHKNGFPRMAISDTVKQLAAEYGEIPSFDFEVGWYPLSARYSGLCRGARVTDRDEELIDLAPSFVLLGLNICQNAIKFGERPRLNSEVYPPAYEIPFARERMERFISCYWGLRWHYPDIVFDEEFNCWMQETDLKKYVAEYDFGDKHPPQEEWGEFPPTVKQGRFFVFDSSKLKDGSFCWAKGCWARKEDAERYAIGVLTGTLSEMGHLHVDGSARPPSMIPLKAVGRVLRGTGEGHASAHLVVTFDYGTEQMRGEMAFGKKEMPAIEQFDDEARYALLLREHSRADTASLRPARR